MSQYKIVKDYKKDEQLRLSFNELAKDTFGIDFEPWYQNGFWNDRYICYSIIDHDKVVANVSVNKLSIMWDGKELQAIQIGTVMTHPDYRMKGLGRRLMEAVLEDYDKACDFIYLFGNDGAYDFYTKFGFAPIEEQSFALAHKPEGKQVKAAIRKLDMSNEQDLDIIKRLAKNRTYVSEKFSVKDDEHLLLFYMLYVFKEDIYYFEDEDMIVIYKVEDNELQLYDILYTDKVDVEEVISKVMTDDMTKVIFNFTPDIDRNVLEVKKLETDDSTLLVKNLTHKITQPFMFPEISHA